MVRCKVAVDCEEVYDFWKPVFLLILYEKSILWLSINWASMSVNLVFKPSLEYLVSHLQAFTAYCARLVQILDPDKVVQ